jgi:hypothetical protein
MLKASFALDCSRQLVNKHLQNQNTKNEKIWSDTYKIKSIFKTNFWPLLQKLGIFRLISIWRSVLVFYPGTRSQSFQIYLRLTCILAYTRIFWYIVQLEVCGFITGRGSSSCTLVYNQLKFTVVVYLRWRSTECEADQKTVVPNPPPADAEPDWGY